MHQLLHIVWNPEIEAFSIFGITIRYYSILFVTGLILALSLIHILIEFSKFLATIKIDVPITLNMDELKREEPDEEELRKIFEEMEFRTLIDRVFNREKKTASAGATSMSHDKAPVSYTHLDVYKRQ